jgi:hypothetical protein
LKNLQNDGLIGVAVIINKKSGHDLVQFTANDETVLNELLALIGVAIYNSMLYEMLRAKEKHASEVAGRNATLYQVATVEAQKNQALLDCATSLFSEDDVNLLGLKIISNARELINADKASIFLHSQANPDEVLIQLLFKT